MATTSMWPIRNTGSRAVKTIVAQLVAYAENEEKTKKPREKELKITKDPRETVQSVMSYVSDKNEGMKYVTGVNCSAEHAVEEMMITKRHWLYYRLLELFYCFEKSFLDCCSFAVDALIYCVQKQTKTFRTGRIRNWRRDYISSAKNW